jgi:hypothetical protein
MVDRSVDSVAANDAEDEPESSYRIRTTTSVR